MSEYTVTQTTKILPAVALRGFVVFPNSYLQFEIGREKSIRAVMNCMENDCRIFLVAQIDADKDDPEEKDLTTVGVIAEVKQVVKNSDDSYKVVVEGLTRAKLVSVTENQEFIETEVVSYPTNNNLDDTQAEAYVRSVKQLFSEYAQLTPKMPKDFQSSIATSISDPSELIDYIGANVLYDPQEKQELLEITDLKDRFDYVLKILQSEINVLSLERGILEKVKENMDLNQKDHFLREQMRAISQELGEEDGTYDEIEEYRKKIIDLHAGIEVTEKLLKETDKLGKLQYGSPEASVIRSYLDICLEIPFSVETKAETNLKHVQEILDRDHYGMAKIKDRITELMAVQAISEKGNGQILCLAGPPGVGKTSVGKSIAEASGRTYVRVSLGGVRDEADIRGHRKTYVGSMPGRIVEALIKAKSNNPLILLDEVDKMSHDYKGDPASALLEVLDSEQNKEFRDHYVELPIDLSKVMFIATANNVGEIPAPLLDRMDLVEMPSYTRDEKYHIAKKFLVPKQLKKAGIPSENFSAKITFTDKAIWSLIDEYTRESGVRTLERTIASCIAKAVKEAMMKGVSRVSITDKKLLAYLGAKKYLVEKKNDKKLVGTVNGLAWTSVGGELLPIEASVLPGTGKLELTGNLGDIMKESAKLAISYVRSVAEQYGISPNFYSEKDIHIHAPEGAVPKDGPSAGIALATVILSALTGMTIDQNIAMTGEISLLGNVMPIGGLREKSMAAHRAGIRTVFIPKENVPNLEELDDVVRNELNFIPVQKIDEVFSAVFKGQIHQNKIPKLDLKKHDREYMTSRP